MNIEVGLQLYSVRNELEKDYVGTLEKLVESGITNFELLSKTTEQGLVFGNNINGTDHRKILDRLGVKAECLHMMPIDNTPWDAVIDSALATGSNSIIIPFALFASHQDVINASKEFNRIGEMCAKKSVQLYFHNHFLEFLTFDGEIAFDTMLNNMDPELVKIEFDTYWCVRGGQDPIAWLKKMGKRCDLLHQKDMPASVNPVSMIDVKKNNPTMADMELFGTIDVSHFAEVGSGCLPVPEYMRVGVEYGNARYIFIDQDMTTMNEVDSVVQSFKYLTGVAKSN